MADVWPLIAAAAAAFIAAAAGTGLASRVLARRGILDLPNERSSHERATPRGGGIAVVAAIAVGVGILAAAGSTLPDGLAVVLPVALVLAIVSWADDVRGLPAAARLLAQAVCVGVSLYLLPVAPIPALATFPAALQLVIMAVAWLWFINLYNFMDGIDGITGVETLVVTLGVASVLAVSGQGIAMISVCVVIAAAMPGFLVWNWPPAKIFMGDVGSVTLGYLLGWLLLSTATGGLLVAALLIPGYYLADATFTLLRRAARGEKVWQAHREHAYQRAVRNGMTHGRVSLRVGVLGAVLIVLAVVSMSHPWPASAAAVVIVAAMLHHFTRHPK